MKNLAKLFGATIIIAVIVFSFAACGDGAGGTGEEGGYTVLKLSGQVYEESEYEESDKIFRFSYIEYTGANCSVSSDLGGSGAITNGKLSFSIGTPNAADLVDKKELGTLIEFPGSEEYFKNLDVSTPDAKYAVLNLKTPNGMLTRQNLTYETDDSGTYSEVLYIYADRDVSAKADRHHFIFSDEDYTETLTINASSYSIKKGWNTINFKSEQNFKDASTVSTITAANPKNLLWVLGDRKGDASGKTEPQISYVALSLSGQVYVETGSGWGKEDHAYGEFYGNERLYSRDLGGSGSLGGGGDITNGQLRFTIDEPSYMDYIRAYLETEGLTNLKVSPDNAKGNILMLKTAYGKEIKYGDSTVTYYHDGGNNNDYSMGYDDIMVQYIFIDRDVTVSADKTVFPTQNAGDEIRYTTHNAFKIDFKAGWNVLYNKAIGSRERTGDTTIRTETRTTTLSLEPDDMSRLKWIIEQ